MFSSYPAKVVIACNVTYHFHKCNKLVDIAVAAKKESMNCNCEGLSLLDIKQIEFEGFFLGMFGGLFIMTKL